MNHPDNYGGVHVEKLEQTPRCLVLRRPPPAVVGEEKAHQGTRQHSKRRSSSGSGRRRRSKRSSTCKRKSKRRSGGIKHNISVVILHCNGVKRNITEQYGAIRNNTEQYGLRAFSLLSLFLITSLRSSSVFVIFLYVLPFSSFALSSILSCGPSAPLFHKFFTASFIRKTKKKE